MEVRTGLAIGGCVGVVVGLLGGRVWEVFAQAPEDAVVATPDAREPVDAPDRASARLVDSTPAADVASSREDAEPEPDSGGSAREEANAEALIGPALLRYAVDEIAAGWEELRTDPISAERAGGGFAEFKSLVHLSPRAIGRRLAELQTERELAEGVLVTDDPIKLLKALARPGVGPVLALVGDPAKFDELFRREQDVGFVQGVNLGARPDDSVADGAVVRFPAGAFLVHHLMDHKDPFPSEVTLQGAGMNATLLVIPELYTRSALRTFAIRDCTVFTDDNYLFDLRLEPATMEFERVRFTGFDMGAGSSCLLGTKETAVKMTNCIVEGGYGRSPRYGQLFDVRTDGLVGRFEDTTFRRMRMELSRVRRGATLVFDRCRMEEVFDDPVKDAEKKPGIVLENCYVTRFEGDRNEVPRLDLDDLFPGWEAAIGR